ncbi:ATP-dependent Clp protease ATP-binding subunit ClpC [Stackebrandtia albiflava]|uniref:ATP-dependent Clp protease ATP-binding subunit ClpC n=1 Tax=Stackebrandtia albiflava TaxID=406432 RepID=A0A562URI0_9ACTN|nr:Clp protease N-terminal domain-containing protein [Stackebrandtia albiflava]TWJ08211.1 ATP-dependent Clp protease ATP-binding subunit ClpC [Stackebrandtia albiflava]
MFETFSDRARRVIVLAQQEARALRHPHIGTGHLLLGLGRENDGVGAYALRSHGLTADRLRAGVVAVVGSGTTPPTADLSFTPRAVGALTGAPDRARSLGNPHVATEHLLLSVLGDPESTAVRVVTGAGVDLDAVRRTAVSFPTGPAATA